MIEFSLMKVEGFASIEDEQFDWGLPGLNIIQAPNGFGKSKFINALVWCLFGKTLSGSVEPWVHTRSSSYKGTKVSVVFEKDQIASRVIRYKDYGKMKNALILEIDGEEFKGGKDEAKFKIQELIGYTYELFINSIIFGQKLKKIIAESGPNKKKVFDDAFEVAFIPKAKKLADDKLKKFRLEQIKQQSAVELLEEKISGKSSQFESESLMVENFEEDKIKQIKVERNKISVIKEKIEALEPKKHPKVLYELKSELELLKKDAYDDKEIIKLEKELSKLESSQESLERETEDLIKRKNQLELDLKNLPEKCDHCERPYTTSDKKKQKEIILKNTKEIDKTYTLKTNELSGIKGQIKEQNSTIASAEKTKETIEYIKERLDLLEEAINTVSEYLLEIKEIKIGIKEIKKKTLINNLEKLSLELSELRGTLKKERRQLKLINKDVEIHEWLIKDPLSNSGLKAFIFNQMLDSINDRLEHYTTYIGFQVAFMIDMQSANKNLEAYVFREGEPVPYEDLSGGQQQTVDVVTAFAIHDVVSDSKTCSLLVMDEVFESLDKRNIEIVSELIQEKAEHKNLYLITHSSEFNPTNANFIQIEYVNGVSRIG